MKNIYNKILLIVLTLTTGVGIVSCVEDNEIDYGEGPVVVRFTASNMSQNFLKDGSGAVYDCEIPLEYRGGRGIALSVPVTVTVAVNKEKSTATEGKEFELTTTEFTIPEGAFETKTFIKVKSEELDADDPKQVVLDIVSASKEVTVSDNPSVAVTLQAICPSNLAGEYVYTTGAKRDITITETGSGTYSVSADDYFRGEYSFNITDVCGKLTVTGGFLTDNYGIAVSGSGTVDEETGEITITYTADGYISDRKMIMKKK